MTTSNVLDLAKLWLETDVFAHTRLEIEQLLANNDEKELTIRLQERIAFGTAGLRARMAAGFSCMNELIIIQTTQGLVKYLASQQLENDKQRGIVIGYDGRHNSKNYAQLTAIVFLSSGYTVHLFPQLACTPIVPFSVIELNCVAGIMITASHNPKMDNGYKLYWHNGCQIVEPHDEGISKCILQNLAVWPQVKSMIPTNYIPDSNDTWIAPNHLLKDPSAQIDNYFNKIKQYSHNHSINASRKNPITYTAMHGVGAPWVTRAFQVFDLQPYIPVSQQILPDPDFSTVAYPNPEEGKGALSLAIQTAQQHDSKLILANDPDADRLAVAERQTDGEWRIFNGNEIAVLMAHWVWTRHKKQFNPSPQQASNCVMINSTVSSKILRAMAHHEGFRYEETLTGFKWIGNKAHDEIKNGRTFLFGYEVEIGFLVGDISLDKDGVRCAAIFAEMALDLYHENQITLARHLEDLYDLYGHYLMRTRYYFCDKADKLIAVMNQIRTMGDDGSYPKRIPNLVDNARPDFVIRSVRDLTCGIDTSQPDGKPTLPTTPNAQMITFTFEDSSTCTLRNSGTEPKLKYYVEVNDKNKEAAQVKLQQLTYSVLNYLLRPQETGLVAPKDE
ncbi:phosphoglucomutase [Acrasis kona]|uniref:Phosphoglucomutase n=1 Tax=Acrasis kona TaxID=1008807 RepID=A0AAW2ZDE0_9EUKA